MIKALEHFDSVTAAGILARAALALEDNPAGTYRIPGEADLREQVIAEALQANGFQPADRTQEALRRLDEVLDEELELLIAPADSKQALERLSVRGALPSDLFTIDIIPQIAEFHGRKFERERQLIQQTVRAPDREQHYGPTSDPENPAMISLFARHFSSDYPMRSFTMLVAGRRSGLTLVVHQAWRIYPDVVPEGALTLVDLLRRFSDQFGHKMTVGNKTANFFLLADLPEGVRDLEAMFQVTPDEAKHGRAHLTFSWFFQRDPTGSLRAALLVSINQDKYRKFLESRGY
jgi:hypothetical protein